MIPEDAQDVVNAAMRARERSLAPFSNFHVGAAIESEDGRIYTGCNIESASYGLTVCAERVAVWAALSDGERRFKRLVVVADTAELTPPCGACRQIIWEFCREATITLINLEGASEDFTAADLLPRGFDERFLRETRRPV